MVVCSLGAWTPPEAMSAVMRYALFISPLYCSIDAACGIVLKGAGLDVLWPSVLGRLKGDVMTRTRSIAKTAPSALPSDHADELDRTAHAALAKLTGGIAPSSLQMAWFDWATHFAANPAKQFEALVVKPVRKAARLGEYLVQAPADGGAQCIEPLEQDQRFRDPAWQRWPFNTYQQAFLLTQQWLHNLTTGVRGVEKHHEDVVAFTARQWLDMMSPTNFIATNPLVLRQTLATGGANLVQGAMNWADDFKRVLHNLPPEGAEAFRPGHEVAVTPGKVVYRNDLVELIQYSPSTASVHPEPVLIVPAWIMKYYILDLSPHNSLIKYLVDHGHTVFAISWKNPGAADRELSMDDYLERGLFDSLRAVQAIVPKRRVHAVGYCLGGTLLSIGAAALAREGADTLASISLFAAQTDFTEPGELALFIDESQVSFLDDVMWDRGYLESSKMAGAFQLLRSYDLIWSRMVQDYLLGERPAMNDLMAWNADTTRMPYRMHSQYLRRLFLDNDLASGRYLVDGRPVSLNDLHVPIFMVGTRTDHVAPWRSVYKLHLLTDAEITFVLTSGGHNAGIVSEPGHAHRSYQTMTRPAEGRYVDPDSYLAQAQSDEGSWWPAWQAWLAEHSGARVKPPATGKPGTAYAVLADAPGSYVLQR
jgi:polyhydroxyalkanoate synthase subunit PhaC